MLAAEETAYIFFRELKRLMHSNWCVMCSGGSVASGDLLLSSTGRFQSKYVRYGVDLFRWFDLLFGSTLGWFDLLFAPEVWVPGCVGTVLLVNEFCVRFELWSY